MAKPTVQLLVIAITAFALFVGAVPMKKSRVFEGKHLRAGPETNELQEKWGSWTEIKMAAKNFYSKNLVNRVKNVASGNNFYESKEVAILACDASTIIYFSESEVEAGATYEGEKYRGFEEMGLTKVAFFNDHKHHDVEMALGIPSDGNKEKPMVLTFAGTESMTDAGKDLKALPKDFSKYGVGKVHSGFFDQFSAARPHYIDVIDEYVSKGYSNVVVTGHSLGGAVATLAAADLSHHLRDVTVSAITFGAPKAGNIDFVEDYNTRFAGNSARFVNEDDIIPCIADGFFHTGGLLHYVEADGKWFEGARQRSCLRTIALWHSTAEHSLVEYCPLLKKLPDDHAENCREVWDHECYWTGCRFGGCPTGTREADKKSCSWWKPNSEYCCKPRKVCS